MSGALKEGGTENRAAASHVARLDAVGTPPRRLTRASAIATAGAGGDRAFRLVLRRKAD